MGDALGKKGRVMSINGRIATTFGTYQADLFESGLVAQIGPNAFATWSAIKAHSDYQTGIAWPSIRRLMLLTGLASATVQKCLDTLEASHLLRSEVKNKRRYYVARERLDVAVGKRVLCTVVVDYVPATMRDTLKRVKDAIENDGDQEVLALVDIIPGEGLVWDDNAKILRASVPASELPTPDKSEQLADVGQRIARRAQKLLKK